MSDISDKQKPADSAEQAIVSNENKPTVVDDEIPQFSSSQWLTLFQKRRFHELSEEFLRILKHFTENTYLFLSPKLQNDINFFVENFLFLFCHPDFKLPADITNRFICANPVIGNIVAMSNFKTTTPWVVRLAADKASYFKLLTLTNIRTETELDQSILFDINTIFGSHWWAFYWISTLSFCTKAQFERIRRHLLSLDPRFVLFHSNARTCYFPVTYIAPDDEGPAKSAFCKLAAKAFGNVVIRNTPNKKKIALISGKWYGSAVYTSISPLIKSLAGHYDISMIKLTDAKTPLQDSEMFEQVTTIKMVDEEIDLEQLQDNNFSAVIYPDIGMTPESIYLSTIRIAPIQIAAYGHPSSTRSPEIDYFIGGAKTEDAARAHHNYSERLVLLPGVGVCPVFPQFQRTLPLHPTDIDPIIINCQWTAQKLTYPLVYALLRVLYASKRPIVFRMFPGNALMKNNEFIPFLKDIESMLGPGRIFILPNLPKDKYLKELQRAHFSIDSNPFGGFNTVMDALYMRKPIVTWKSSIAAGRIASASLEALGLGELVCESEDQYIEKILRLAHDDQYRTSLYQKIDTIAPETKGTSIEEPQSFRRAIDYLIENHDRLKGDTSRDPIFIQ